MGFSNQLALLRREKGCSQRQAAADLGISQALLSHYEKGLREPRLEFVVKCCDYYGVSADFILGRTDKRGDDESVILLCEKIHSLSALADELFINSRSKE